MKIIFSVFILTYFFLGSLVLPQGDFSVLPQLPRMYNHCKLAEDPDMNLFDFIADHLMGIDGSFDKHEADEDEKPHSTVPFQQQQHQSIFNNVSFVFHSSNSILPNFIAVHFIEDFYSFGFISNIFHPPSC